MVWDPIFNSVRAPGRLYMLVAKTKIFWTIPEPRNFYFWWQEVNTSMHFWGFNKEFVKSLILIYMCGILFFFLLKITPHREAAKNFALYAAYSEQSEDIIP